MSQNAGNLKDVKCESCKRVIGQRRGEWFFYKGLWSQHRRSFPYLCPFGCRDVQSFKVNRNNDVVKVGDFQAQAA